MKNQMKNRSYNLQFVDEKKNGRINLLDASTIQSASRDKLESEAV